VVLGVDVNEKACAVAARTATENKRSIEIIRSNLLTGLRRVYGKVDILVFNPPYVPTEETE
jgi:release factor glutamine methyltransferase